GGLFTPPSFQGTISIPGHNGGANWGSTAVDPTKGTMYVVSKNLPTLDKLMAPVAAGQRGRGGRGDGAAAPAADAPARGAREGAAPGGPEGRGAGPAGAAPGGPEGRGQRVGGPPPPAGPPPNAGPDFVAYTSPYDFLFQSNGLSAIGPPWSNITAYDLNKGTILWQI